MIDPESEPAWIAAPCATTSSGLIDALGLAAEHLCEAHAYRRDPRCRAADAEDVADLVRRQARLGEHLLGDLDRAADVAVDQLLELRTIESERQRADLAVRQVDAIDLAFGGVILREVTLDGLGAHHQLHHQYRVLARIEAKDAIALRSEHLGEGAIEIIAAKEEVAVGREHLEHVAVDLEDRDVERAAAEIEHADELILVAAEAVRERGRRGLVDQARDREAGEPTGFLGRGALGVGEVRRHGDDRVADAGAELAFGAALEMEQHVRRDLGHRHPAIAHGDDRLLVRTFDDLVADAGQRELDERPADVLADEPLGRVDDMVWLGEAVALGIAADHDTAACRERDHRRMDALGVWPEDELHTCWSCHGGTRVRGPEVDAQRDRHPVDNGIPTSARFPESGRWGQEYPEGGCERGAGCCWERADASGSIRLRRMPAGRLGPR